MRKSVANCQANNPVTVGSTTSGVTFESAAQTATNTPTLTTQLSQTTISPGSSVFDTAMLGSAITPMGKIAFYVSSTNTCPNTSASQVGGAATVTGGGSYLSPSLAFSTPGTYYWYATYTGD